MWQLDQAFAVGRQPSVRVHLQSRPQIVLIGIVAPLVDEDGSRLETQIEAGPQHAFVAFEHVGNVRCVALVQSGGVGKLKTVFSSAGGLVSDGHTAGTPAVTHVGSPFGLAEGVVFVVSSSRLRGSHDRGRIVGQIAYDGLLGPRPGSTVRAGIVADL